ncbi:MAG: MFS transporter [Firmicutes bacterium]|nr:MFS transporter [Bacillota bacterium]
MTARSRIFTPAFTLLFGLCFLTFFAAFQLFPTVPLRLLELGASVQESGRFLSVFTAGSALGALFTGPLGDRVGQRRMVVAGAFLFALCAGSYGFIQHRLWIYALALPHGLVWSGLLTGTMASLGSVLPEDRRADGLTLFGLASPGGVIFGPMVGLAEFHRWGFGPLTWILAFLFFVLALLALALPPDRRDRERRSVFQWPERKMLRPCSVLFATALGYGAMSTYTAQEALKLDFQPFFGIPTTSAFLSCMAVGMVGMRIVMTRIGFGSDPVRLLPRMLWVAFGGLVLLALMPGGALRHAVSALLYGSGYSMVHTLVNTHVLEVIHADRRGAAFGATLFAFDSGIGLGSFLIGMVIGHSERSFGPVGYRWGWAVAALAAGLALPLAYGLLKARRARSPMAAASTCG